MYTENSAEFNIVGELDSSDVGFSVKVDYLDEESPFCVTLSIGSHWISEADFNEMFGVMRKARSAKKAGFKP